MTHIPPPPAHPFLCERCGYALDGLPLERSCPECAAPAADSLPQRRTGTPWQRSPSAAAWLSTTAAVLRSPGPLFTVARIELPRSRSLARWNILLAALLLVAGWLVQIVRTEYQWRIPAAELIGAAVFHAAVVLPIAAGLLWLATWIETAGLRIIGRRRGWRVTRTVAWTVCGHASIGWTIAGVLWLGGVLLAAALDLSAITHPAPGVTVINHLRPWYPALAGLFIGLMVFEVLVNIGVRRCRYTNAPP